MGRSRGEAAAARQEDDLEQLFVGACARFPSLSSCRRRREDRFDRSWRSSSTNKEAARDLSPPAAEVKKMATQQRDKKNGGRERHTNSTSQEETREKTHKTHKTGDKTHAWDGGGTYIGVERTIPWLIVDRREREERHRGGGRESQSGVSMNLLGQSRRSSRWSSSRGAGGSLPIHLSSSQLGEVGLEVPNSVVVPPSDGEPSRLWLRLGWGEWRKRASFVP